MQTFLNEDKLFHAIADLPDKMDFMGTVIDIATHPKFHVLESMNCLYYYYIFYQFPCMIRRAMALAFFFNSVFSLQTNRPN